MPAQRATGTRQERLEQHTYSRAQHTVARRSELQPILLLDTAKMHFSTAVLQACSRTRVWPVLVPASTTWLLQPLDTHAFAAYRVRTYLASSFDPVWDPMVVLTLALHM